MINKSLLDLLKIFTETHTGILRISDLWRRGFGGKPKPQKVKPQKVFFACVQHAFDQNKLDNACVEVTFNQQTKVT